MKNKWLWPVLCLSVSLSVASLYAQEENDPIHREITEGKILASEILMTEDLVKEVSDKQMKAANLIALLGEMVHSRISDEALKEEIQYVHSGFIARLQGIREDQEALARKEIQPDLATLQNYSRRLDSLIADIKLYLK